MASPEKVNNLPENEIERIEERTGAGGGGGGLCHQPVEIWIKCSGQNRSKFKYTYIATHKINIVDITHPASSGCQSKRSAPPPGPTKINKYPSHRSKKLNKRPGRLLELLRKSVARLLREQVQILLSRESTSAKGAVMK